MASPADIVRAVIQAADAVEETQTRERHGYAVTCAVDVLGRTRTAAKAAGLVECWLRRETVEAVRLARVLHEEPETQRRAVCLVARDLAMTTEKPTTAAPEPCRCGGEVLPVALGLRMCPRCNYVPPTTREDGTP